MRRSVLAASAAVLLLAAGCGGGVDAGAAESAFVSSAGGPVGSLCDSSSPSWSCFYDGVEAQSDYLVVKLTADGGADGSTLAASAGRAWFNFIHCQFPDLQMIVVRINGVDHNVARSSTTADRMPC